MQHRHTTRASECLRRRVYVSVGVAVHSASVHFCGAFYLVDARLDRFALLANFE